MRWENLLSVYGLWNKVDTSFLSTTILIQTVMIILDCNNVWAHHDQIEILKSMDLKFLKSFRASFYFLEKINGLGYIPEPFSLGW